MSEDRRELSATGVEPDDSAEVTPATRLPSVAPSALKNDGENTPTRLGSSPAPERRRGRIGLRIPDDEISRPQPPVVDSIARNRSGPPPQEPVEPGPIVKPTRIITINPPEPESVDSQAVVVPPSPATPSAPQVDDHWDSSPNPLQSAADEEEAIATEPELPLVPSTPPVDAEASPAEVGLYDDLPTPTLPPVQSDGERRSDPGEEPEISAEDLVAVEALPPMRPTAPSYSGARPPVKKSPLPARPPLVIIPPHLGNFAQQPESVGSRRKGRLWWEELFNDDYLRTMEKMSDEQIAREVGFIEESLGVERGGALLDLGCGTGRHAIELAHRGYEVVGFDLSLAMLARAGDEAQDRAVKLNFVQGDMREMTFEEQFDGVYSWSTSFGYFEEDKNAQVIDRVHHALKGGGLFLLDVVNRDFLVTQSPSLAWFEGDGCVCMDEMTVDFITSRMRVKRTLMLDDGRTREIEYSMRVYSLHELGKILHEHGFKVCEVTGRIAAPGVFFGNESPRTIILAEKR